MQISFNPASSNINYQKKPSFKSLKDGIIVAEEVAKYASNATICGNYIYVDGYKLITENLKALVDALDIANKNISSRVGILAELDDTIDIFIKKAKEKNVLNDIIKKAKEQDIAKDLVEKAKKYNIDLGFLLNT